MFANASLIHLPPEYPLIVEDVDNVIACVVYQGIYYRWNPRCFIIIYQILPKLVFEYFYTLYNRKVVLRGHESRRPVPVCNICYKALTFCGEIVDTPANIPSQTTAESAKIQGE